MYKRSVNPDHFLFLTPTQTCLYGRSVKTEPFESENDPADSVMGLQAKSWKDACCQWTHVKIARKAGKFAVTSDSRKSACLYAKRKSNAAMKCSTSAKVTG